MELKDQPLSLFLLKESLKEYWLGGSSSPVRIRRTLNPGCKVFQVLSAIFAAKEGPKEH